VLIVSNDSHIEEWFKGDIVYNRVAVYDTESDDLYSHFDVCHAFIDSVLRPASNPGPAPSSAVSAAVAPDASASDEATEIAIAADIARFTQPNLEPDSKEPAPAKDPEPDVSRPAILVRT
jgi:hypothetical protein